MSFTPIQNLFPSHTVTGLSCAICTEGFASADGVLAHGGTVPHAFHTLCIQEWLHVGSKCPTCNLQVTHVNGVTIADLRRAREQQWEAEVTAARAQAGQSLYAASGEGDLQRVQALLANGPISESDRGWAVWRASENGHVDTIQTLLANGTISENDRGNAVCDASGNGHQAIVEALLTNGPISDDHRGNAIWHAIRRDNLAILQVLLANGSISEEHRGNAVSHALRYGNLAIIRALLANGTISQVKRGEFVRHASENGHLTVLQALLPDQTISDELRQAALTGLEEGYPANAAEIRAFLQELGPENPNNNDS